MLLIRSGLFLAVLVALIAGVRFLGWQFGFGLLIAGVICQVASYYKYGDWLD